MDEQKANKKELKRAYKKAKRKTVTPWKVIAIILAVLTVIATPLNIVLHMFDNTVAAFVGGTFWELENPDPHAEYFHGDFATVEEMIAYGLEVCRQVEAEGAALLMNENNALPLGEGAMVSCFSSSSVNLVYGGTGSGNIDASTADTLRSALEKSGVSVNDTLWSFYTEGAGKDYVRDSGGFTSGAAVGEVPWSVYTDEVKSSVAQYGDAAIVVLSRVGGEGVDLEFQDVNYLALDDNEKDMMKNLADMKAAGAIQKIVVLLNTANTLQVDFLKNNEYDVDAVLWIGDVGITGINAVADILAGRVNPSGSLADTYCYDNYSSPAMANFVPTVYEGYVKGEIPDNAKSYMIYQEGIYVGYKYYETRYVPFRPASPKKAEEAFQKAMAGKEISIKDAERYQTAILLHLGREYHRLDIAMQLHYSCLRNNNERMYAQMGPDTGFDMIAQNTCGGAIAQLLSALDAEGKCPKTILYSLNPTDNAQLGSLVGCFQTDEIPGKIQHGSAWWFNDTKSGMEEQMKSLANLGLLGNFVGMLTDSRSFLSYARHDYFRRILCNLIGGWVENGEYPNHDASLKKIVEGICYNNAARYFGL